MCYLVPNMPNVYAHNQDNRAPVQPLPPPPVKFQVGFISCGELGLKPDHLQNTVDLTIVDVGYRSKKMALVNVAYFGGCWP